jgi:hypothetical protein
MTATSASSASNANPFPDVPTASPLPARPRDPTTRWHPRPRFGDYSRTRFESRVAFGGADEEDDAEEIAAPTRRFSLLEITSGLPDDSREEDEREAERRLREVRARVKAARAVVATTSGSPRRSRATGRGPRDSTRGSGSRRRDSVTASPARND